MVTKKKECDSYIIDTYKIPETGHFVPGAITFCGRKKMEFLQWKEHEFQTQQEADAFVRTHFIDLHLPEVSNEGELTSKYTR